MEYIITQTYIILLYKYGFDVHIIFRDFVFCPAPLPVSNSTDRRHLMPVYYMYTQLVSG